MASKFKKLGIACLSLFTVLSFASCSSDEIIAKPSNYESHIISGKGTDQTTDLQDVWNNVYRIVEKAYHDGDSFKTDVVTDVMNTYAVSMFGQYNRKSKSIIRRDNKAIITLKEAYKDSKSSMSEKTTANNFIDEHPVYHVFNDEAKKVHNREAEYDLLESMWNTIEERISIAMYDKISGTTYKDRNKFYEKKFVKSLKNDMKKIKDKIEENELHECLMSPDIKKENIWDYDEHAGFLNRDIYQYHYGYNEEETTGEEQGKEITYVEDELIPTIYNDLLIEQYIMIENPNALGRSNARKVNILTVNKSSDNDDSAKNIIKAFRDRIFCVNNYESKTAKNLSVIESDFTAYSKLINCTDEDLTSLKIVNGLGVTEDDLVNMANKVFGQPVECNNYKEENGNLHTYYKGSEYGAIIKEYDKISDNPDKTDSSVLSTYTGSGAYKKEFGLQMKQDEVSLKSHVTTGWYVKDGLSSLPDSIKNRLFSSAVANDKKEKADETSDLDRNVGDNKVYTKDPLKESNFVAVVNGKYYLKTATQPQGTADEDDIVFEDSGNYYIVQIEEAVNLAKITAEAGKPGGYSSEGAKQDIKNKIAKILAKTESYQTLAKKHWLEKMGLSDAGNYHDQQIYNYFVATYPKLFE